ncbi:RidA family protein [Granulosicoccus antarcticus]|uniref:Uncharacterized protein n=1 Tax=Granulosicoccus antarcticus IMCC3135 TaxID=1192854 RepID=A0A2Z2NNN2_9GAMM|nr:RidA family protein [Granulosicoccus antarcticus]ASJ72829.1 hypothetical protein IMCC3135_13720 [Granulosicoccus antarcticus IMCC3135]
MVGLEELGLSLPLPPKPIGNYLPAVVDGDMLYVSRTLGTIRDENDNDIVPIKGKLGSDLTIEQGYQSARYMAPSIAALEADDEYFKQINLLTLRNTMLGNFLGTPGVSLPVGKDGQGLPVGMLVSAAMDRDDQLSRIARVIQNVIER